MRVERGTYYKGKRALVEKRGTQEILIEAFIRRARTVINETENWLMKIEKGHLSEGKRALIRKVKGHVSK